MNQCWRVDASLARIIDGEPRRCTCTVPGTHPPLLPPAPTNGQVASHSHGCAVVLGCTQQPSAVTNDAGPEPGTHHSDSLRQVAAWMAYPQHVDREGPPEELGQGR